jgi:hypothetical protein
MNSSTVTALVIVGILLGAGAVIFVVLKRRRDKETARVAAFSPTEREAHDAQIAYAADVKSAELVHKGEVKARESRMKAATKGLAAANALGSRSIGSIRGKEGTISANELMISINGASYPLDSSISARVDTAGNFATSSRTTFTRVAAGGLLFGPVGAIVGASAKKNKSHDLRELYLLVEGPEFAAMLTCNPDHGSRVRQFATALKQAGLAAPQVLAHRVGQIEIANAALAAETANVEALDSAATALAATRLDTRRIDAAARQLAIESPIAGSEAAPATA